MLDLGAVFVGDLVAFRHHVGAVNREAGGDFANGAPDLGTCIVAPVAIVFAYFDEQARQAIHVAAQGLVFDA